MDASFDDDESISDAQSDTDNSSVAPDEEDSFRKRWGDICKQDEEELLIVQEVMNAWTDRRAKGRFKVHQNRVDWQGHVSYLLHARANGCKFAQTYRMPLRDFNGLVDILHDDVYIDEMKSRNSTGGEADPIFPELVVALGLRWIGGDTASLLADWAGISDGSFVRCRNLFLNAVENSKDVKLQIKFPDSLPEARKNASEFQSKATDHIVFPNCVGCIDGILLRINQPRGTDKPRNFFSGHYECFGVNMQAVCDAHLRFIYVAAGGPGSTADISAFNSLSIRNMVADLPEGYYILGDAAYVTLDKLLTPFTGAARAVWYQDVYNFFLSQLRIRIEMAFGRLTTKWRIFRQPMETNLQTTIKVFHVACKLHNYVINRQIENGETDDEEVEAVEHDNARRGLAYLEGGYIPEADEEVVGGSANNSSKRQEILEYIQEHQVQRPTCNIERQQAERN